MKRLVHGVGVNDMTSEYRKSGKILKFYDVWQAMINRCYGKKSLEKKPLYADITVCDEWLTLSKFKAWFDDNYIDGYQLDKDIVDPESKMYCPSSCRFVPQEINKLFTDRRRFRGEFPLGVSRVESGKFAAYVSMNGYRYRSALYVKSEDAHSDYLRVKASYCKKIAREYEGRVCKDVIQGIRDKVSNMLHCAMNGIEYK
jgi:hypothetical protein